jgi:hypothetical protein
MFVALREELERSDAGMYSPDHVRPLKSLHTYFIEVLLNDFELQRHGRGVTLVVEFDDNAPTLTGRSGLSHVRSKIPDFDAKVREHRNRLDAFFRGESSRLVVSDPEFPFRYASGGALPVAKIGDKEYYVLFYRECFPIGWNLANGGTDGRHELLNPYITVERELREELLIFDCHRRQRYVLDIESDNPEDMPEYIAARRLWQEQLSSKGWPPIGSFRQILTPLKWIDGPDCLEVRVNGELPKKLTNCFLNINPEDFGIEIDRIAKINVDETVTFCDGELLGNRLTDSIVGLFEVRRMNQLVRTGATQFIPDRYFYGGEGFDSPDPGQLERKISEDYVSRIQRYLPSWDRREWDDHPFKFDLCPVTRGIAERAVRLQEPVGVSHGDYDVFVSFANEDEALARSVRDQIKMDTDLSVFFSAELDHSAWGDMIERALASANCLVAVATDPRHLSKPWPEFEYRLFHIQIRNQKKPKSAQVMSYISGFEPADLPLPLPFYNAHVQDDDQPQTSMQKLIRDIKKSFPERM